MQPSEYRVIRNNYNHLILSIQITMSNKRIFYFDLLNIAACFAVICLHHNGIVHEYSNSSVWKQSLVVEVLFFWAVPIFLMLSGANLMQYRTRYSTVEFLKKRIKKVLIPWLFWSIVMLAYKQINGEYQLSRISIKEIMNAILNCKIENVYWFFPVIISVYLFMPFLSMLTAPKYRKVLWYIVICSIVLNATMPLLCTLVGIEWNTNISIPVNGYTIFAILGYLLSTEEINKKNRIIIYAGGIASLIVRYSGIYILSTRDGEKNPLFFNYIHIYSYALACAVFVLFKYMKWEKIMESCSEKKKNYKDIAAYISGASLGIYLTHRLVMSIELNILRIDRSVLFWRIGFPFVTYLVCLMIVLMLKKIPVFKHIVP